MANKKINYDAINFKNKDVDRFSTRFGKQEVVKDPPKNGDPKKKEPAKKEPQGERNPDWLKGEKESGRTNSPYSVATQANELKTPIKKSFDAQGYRPKSGYNYVEVGELTKQDSLDINANRAPTVRNFKIVEQGLMNGVKFPGLTQEFKDSFKNYQKLPQKIK
jgi:hypothetical protein